MLIFPNLFENFYLFYLVLMRVRPQYVLIPRHLALFLILLLIPKLVQEYLLHFAETQPWDRIKRNILRDSWRF